MSNIRSRAIRSYKHNNDQWNLSCSHVHGHDNISVIEADTNIITPRSQQACDPCPHQMRDQIHTGICLPSSRSNSRTSRGSRDEAFSWS